MDHAIATPRAYVRARTREEFTGSKPVQAGFAIELGVLAAND
jgi:hypothetical protein